MIDSKVSPSEPDCILQQSDIPMANVISRAPTMRWFASRFWFLTAVCALISAGLFGYSRLSFGELIEIEFQHGHGIKVEDRLTYRGIEIGIVEKIELHATKEAIIIQVRLEPEARSLASEGAKFWIARPLVSVDSIQGLDTLLGAKYIAIDPAPVGSKHVSRFIGLETPPIVAPPNGALEVSLDGNARGGLENGAPILFRGFRIGNVVHVGLASDARTVRARCAIDPEYRDLVRKNSRFWNRSGWSLELGITGVRLDADSLAQIMSGGIEMATPNESAPVVSTGQRFVLYDKPEPEWLTWKPSLAHGKAWTNLESRMPQPARIAMRWQERSFGFRRNQQRSAWCLPLSDGACLCFSEQIVAPKAALAGSVQIELGGVAITPDQMQFTSPNNPDSTLPSIVRFSTAESMAADIARWPKDRVANKLPEDVCDVLIAHADSTNIAAIDAARLKSTQGGWAIDESITLDADMHGLPVLSSQTSQVIGLLAINKQSRMIVNNP